MGTYLDRTPSSAGNRRTFTISFWTKVTGGFGSSSRWIFGAGTQSSDNDYLLFPSGDTLKFSFATEGSGNVATNRVFRDANAWYHIVVAVDTTQATASNRVKMYVNGDQITSFGTASYPTQNYETSINNTVVNRIGARAYSATGYYNGYLSQFILVDGLQLTPSSFGSTNANGQWVSNSSPSLTFGTNGFKLDFAGTGTSADSSGFGADTSGNNNHFASNNLGTNPNVTDTPENNFCTLDPRQGIFVSSNTFSEGNTKIVTDGSQSYCFVNGTMGFGAGKWYWEMKAVAKSGGSDWYGTGVMVSPPTTSTDYGGGDVGDSGASGCYYYGYGQIRVNGATPNSYGAYTAGDIVSVAMDCDNEAIYFAKNGVWQNSGVPTSGASTTGGQGVTDPYVRSAGFMFWVPGVCGFDGGQDYTMQVNFGNPPFAISSANADANGYGKFEYAVPSGYYAVCSKNIGQYG